MKDWKQDTGSLDLEDILKEFGAAEDASPAAEQAQKLPMPELSSDDEAIQEEVVEAAPEEVAPAEEAPVSDAFPEKESSVTDDTLRLDDLSQITETTAPKDADVTSDTVRLDPAEVEQALQDTAAAEEAPVQEDAEPEEVNITPPPPIVFNPKAKLRELKRKLVAGPERRYYELSEIGVGKLQMAMFLCLVVIAVSAGSAVMYSLDLIPENRMRLMVFGQVLAMLLGALLGSNQLVEGFAALLKGKFTANTLLAVTFLACCADSVFCLQELRVPICAAYTLEVMMSLWGTYHRRVTEMGMMDTMRKAVRLDSVVKCENFYDGHSAIVRGEGQVEDFMDTYNQTTKPERVQNIYALIVLIVSIAVAVAAGVLHGVSLGVQIFSTTLLVAMPASFFIALTRPMAVLERRLHEVGTVLCGWKGVVGLSGKYL